MRSKFKRLFFVSVGITSSVVFVNSVNSLRANHYEVGRAQNSKWQLPDILHAKKFKNRTEIIDSLTLQQVQVVMRHGARTPFKLMPNYEPATWNVEDTADLPHTMIDHTVRTADGGGQPQSAIDNAYLQRDRLKGGSLVGQLTKIGQQQMYDLGKSIKSKYMDQLGFLSPEFNAEEIYVRTTNIVRTVKSVRCVLAAMYGGTKLESPIHFITSVNEHEFLYPNYYFCKNLKHWSEIAWATSEDVPGLTEFYDELGKKLGLGENDEKLSAVGLQDNIRARLAQNSPVPPCVMEKINEMDSFAVKVQMRVIAGTGKSKSILRMSVGNFIENICTQLQDKIEGQSKYKMLLYSAHDTTLMAFLEAFGVYDHKWPRYAADVKIELYKSSANQWYVRFLYNDEDLTLPGCNSPFCPFEKFLDLAKEYRVKDWDAECGITGDYRKEKFAIGTI